MANTEFLGEFFGNSEHGTRNIIYTSRTHPGLLYEFKILGRISSTKTKLRCSGCRSYSRKNPGATYQTYHYASVSVEENFIRFYEDPDQKNHCCERRNPNKVKARQAAAKIIEEIKETGTSGYNCVDKFNDLVINQYKENDEYSSRNGKT